MIDDVTWSFIKANEEDYRHLQKLVLDNEQVFEAIQIIQRMMENIPKSRMENILHIIENHYNIYQTTKNIPKWKKEAAQGLAIALMGAELGASQISQYGIDKKTNAEYLLNSTEYGSVMDILEIQLKNGKVKNGKDS